MKITYWLGDVGVEINGEATIGNRRMQLDRRRPHYDLHNSPRHSVEHPGYRWRMRDEDEGDAPPVWLDCRESYGGPVLDDDSRDQLNVFLTRHLRRIKRYFGKRFHGDEYAVQWGIGAVGEYLVSRIVEGYSARVTYRVKRSRRIAYRLRDRRIESRLRSERRVTGGTVRRYAGFPTLGDILGACSIVACRYWQEHSISGRSQTIVRLLGEHDTSIATRLSVDCETMSDEQLVDMLAEWAIDGGAKDDKRTRETICALVRCPDGGYREHAQDLGLTVNGWKHRRAKVLAAIRVGCPV